MTNTKEILNEFFTQRNSSENTKRTYRRTVTLYEQKTGLKLPELLNLADEEETQNIRWKNTITRKHLINYREYLYQKYNITTARLYLTAIITIYRHFEITIQPLPYYSNKRLRKTAQLHYNELPTREILRECIQVTSPLATSLILFISSSGVSRVDTLNLTIGDYLDATSEYHNHPNDIVGAVEEMHDKSVIPFFDGLVRQKTGQSYFTFCSHEASRSINSYLLTRSDELTRDKSLFKVSDRYFNMIFEQLNDQFCLGKVGCYNRLRSHNLRKYHASRLSEAGMSTDYINLLQGRRVAGVAFESYIRVRPDSIREEYVEALPFLVVDEAERYRSELDVAREENSVLRRSIREVVGRLDYIEEHVSWDDVVDEFK